MSGGGEGLVGLGLVGAFSVEHQLKQASLFSFSNLIANTPHPNPTCPAAEPVRVSVDPGGVVAVASHSDGSIRLTHIGTGHVLWKAWGHGEIVTAAEVASDMEHLVSVSGDGCMYVWRLPEDLAMEIKAAASRVAAARAPLMGEAAPAEEEQPAAAAVEAAEPAATPRQSGCVASAGGQSETANSMGRTIQRVQAGRPLVPKDKLPAWAAAQMSPSPSPTKKPKQAAPAAAEGAPAAPAAPLQQEAGAVAGAPQPGEPEVAQRAAGGKWGRSKVRFGDGARHLT